MRIWFYLLLLMGGIFIPFAVHAQQCTPYTIYKEDFGGTASSPNKGNALPDSVTSYSFTDKVPVEDGFYGIRKEVKGHPSTWHQMSDHTGNGYMMLVNASITPGIFYQKTITGLCQGTSFQFSVWVANLMKKNATGDKDPSLRFVIKDPNTDTTIAETSTGTLQRYITPTWKAYGIQFDLPQGISSVILQIYNNGKGGNGNDLVLDDISFSICGPPIDYTVTGMYQNSSNVCIGEKVVLDAQLPSNAYNQPSYQWQFSTDKENWQTLQGKDQRSLQFNPTQKQDSGWYRMVASEKGNINKKQCRISTDPIPVKVWIPSQEKILTNSPVCEGTKLRIEIPQDTSWTTNWTGPHHFTSNKNTLLFSSAEPNQSGIYTAKIKNPGGCQSSAQKNIIVKKNNLSVSLHTTDSILCKGDQKTLTAKNPGASYLWNTGETTPDIVVNSEGQYKVTVKKDVCSITDSVRLYRLPKPRVDLGTDTVVCEEETFLLNAADKNTEDYLWNNGSRDSIRSVTQPGYYQVTLKNQCGIAHSSIHVEIQPCVNILLFPTAFTPNKDGENDVFKPKVLFAISHYHLEIFDRWGNKIFQSKNSKTGWDGTASGRKYPIGAYIWQVSYERVRDNKKMYQKGTITLIR